MTGSGRCHGPGCTNAALVEGGFCSEVCQNLWNGQFDSRREPHPTQTDLNAALAVLAAVEPPPSAPTLDEVVNTIRSLPRLEPPEPVKLTRGQFDALRGDAPCPGSQFRYGGPLANLTGVSVEIIDEPEKPQVAPKDPQVGFLRRCLDRLAGRRP